MAPSPNASLIFFLVFLSLFPLSSSPTQTPVT
jgi:hypothetical protein